MNTNRLQGNTSSRLLLAIGLAVACTWPLAAQAGKLGANGLGRSEIVRNDLDAAHEAIQVRVDFGPHASAPRHSHPGVEIAYVLEGTIEYELEGKPVTLKAGQALFIPAGAVHGAKNVGSGNASELATYLVEKGKPIVVMQK